MFKLSAFFTSFLPSFSNTALLALTQVIFIFKFGGPCGKFPKFLINGTHSFGSSVDDTFLGHGVDQGSSYDGISKAQVREGLGKDGSSPVQIKASWARLMAESLVQAGPTLDLADRQCEASGEALHGVSRDGGELGNFLEASVSVVEVAGGSVVGTC